ncbi:MAG: endolytic transglycosylase MltG [Opitutaceae bacterium]|nr:endolytic transglycosylase MltG [Cytophagales bacterium]
MKAGLIIFFTIIFTTFIFYGYQVFFSPNILLDKQDSYLFIPTGSTFENVKDSLEKNSMLHDRLSFMFLSKLTGYTKKPKPGRYLLVSGDNNWNTIRKLYSGRQDPVKLTFNNIRLKKEFAQKMGEKFEFTETDLLEKMQDKKFLTSLNTDSSKVMCLFIPNTYELYWNISAEDFLNKMYHYYDKFWTEARKDKAKKIGLTEQQTYILASIVEEETKQADEISAVARVYINRLNCGMKLQADPTVRFAVGDFSLRRIYSGHLAVNSPYNTYKYSGLPPGPICLPTIRTIDSTLAASEHAYLFFCVDISKPGYHKFTKTFGEHVGVANQYRLNLNKRKIK